VLIRSPEKKEGENLKVSIGCKRSFGRKELSNRRHEPSRVGRENQVHGVTQSSGKKYPVGGFNGDTDGLKITRAGKRVGVWRKGYSKKSHGERTTPAET